MLRACTIATDDKCVTVNDATVPEFGVTNATGTFCFCNGDLCNGRPVSLPGSTPTHPGSFPGSTTEGRPGSLPGSAPQAVVGRMAMSFSVISLLALTAARFLN